jgi:hypothetical protein
MNGEATNNQITLTQWNDLIETVKNSPSTQVESDDTLYIGSHNSGNSKRYFCYDNYDRYYIPGLDFVVTDNAEYGNLTVYNGSEMARAPINLEEGKQIARNFFNEYGGQMGEEIVCEWVMNGNASVF